VIYYNEQLMVMTWLSYCFSFFVETLVNRRFPPDQWKYMNVKFEDLQSATQLWCRNNWTDGLGKYINTETILFILVVKAIVSLYGPYINGCLEI
jgi:hypothetical protein